MEGIAADREEEEEQHIGTDMSLSPSRMNVNREKQEEHADMIISNTNCPVSLFFQSNDMDQGLRDLRIVVGNARLTLRLGLGLKASRTSSLTSSVLQEKTSPLQTSVKDRSEPQ